LSANILGKYCCYPQGYAFILDVVLNLFATRFYVIHAQLSTDCTSRFGSVSCRDSAQIGRTIANREYHSNGKPGVLAVRHDSPRLKNSRRNERVSNWFNVPIHIPGDPTEARNSNLSFRVQHVRAAEYVELGPAERPPPLVTARSRLMTSGESITQRLRRAWGPVPVGAGL
jgi:hypothetical protein